MSEAASLAALHPGEIRLWWPMPLAAIIWLLLVWSFAHFLTSPEVEMSSSAPIEASFVELPEAVPAKSPDVRPRVVTQKEKASAKLRRDAPPPAAVAESRPAMPAPPASPEPASDLAPPTDMMSYVNAARARRHAAENAAARENAAATARERGPSAEEIRMANIRRNLQPMGTNGVFQIISMGVRTGKYSFRGWTSDASNARREVIEVDAGPDGDVERAMVRSMIELIRRYYKGDFNWESQRLGRSIVMSARVEDNAGLEDFLMLEFFGAGSGLHGFALRK